MLLGISMLLALLLVAACTDDVSMPTRPGVPAPTQFWNRFYPEISCQRMYAVWGFDADDMWAVGDEGTILHYDGQSVESFDSGTDNQIIDIEGFSPTDIWATTWRDVFHWDGDSWTHAHDLDIYAYSMTTVSTDELFVGGYTNGDTCTYPAISHFDGNQWQPMDFPLLPDERIKRIWQPMADSPLLAATSDRLYRFIDGAWDRVAINYHFNYEVIDTDGDLALVILEPAQDRKLVRFDNLGLPHEICEGLLFTSGELIDSRVPLVYTGNRVKGVVDCTIRNIACDTTFSATSMAKPVRPGPNGPAMFAVGYDGLFAKVSWTGAGSLKWTNLIPSLTLPVEFILTGDQHHVYANHDKNLLVHEDGDWRVETMPFDIRGLWVLGDGEVALTSIHDLAVRHLDGSLTPLPSSPDNVYPIWTDGVKALGRSSWPKKSFWALENGQWAMRDTIPDGTDLIGSFDGEQLYFTAYTDSGRVLMVHDGEEWITCSNPPGKSLSSAYLGDKSGHIYSEFRDSETYILENYIYKNGNWTAIPGDPVYLNRVNHCELSPGHLIVLDEDIYELTDQGWQLLVDIPQGEYIYNAQFWAHPAHGLFSLGSNGIIMQTDYPTR